MLRRSQRDSAALSSTRTKEAVTLLFWPSVMQSAVGEKYDEVRSAVLQSELCFWRNPNQPAAEFVHLKTTALLRKSEEEMRLKKKQPQGQFLPLCSWRCTSPFCFSVAAGPDWLIASLIQFSKAFFKGLRVSLGFCTRGFLLLARRFKLCKVIQRIYCVCSSRKDALHFKPQNAITETRVSR